jgi:hypothetical protein
MQVIGEKIDPLTEHFSLYNLEDYDMHYPRHAWAVGIKSDFPPLLRKRLVGAVVSTQMGGASVDYVIKKYMGEVEEEIEPTKGYLANRFIVDTHRALHSLVEELTEHADDNVGRIMSELTMMRQEYTTRCFLFLANRGAIFEGYSLLRMQMEQFAWIIAADRQEDPEKVKKLKAQSCIRRLDEIAPGTARLYGQLSAHAHWSYDAHVRAITSDEGRLGVLFASVKHKVELLAYGVYFTGLFAKILVALRHDEIAKLDRKGATPNDLEGMYKRATDFGKELFEHLNEEQLPSEHSHVPLV